ncbi:hypothetical protein BJ508DRAFT_332487 [Ascobolus immersus RN42]|uniref:Uncharacterized protein n=1 Tax=Ascobolus immersus RN42 TaxID=1160509 RepID=A0A3N4HZD0_ASCIM|nr:hypothetical protein BJ508DRAFT_332487 [Ascobolus immersus RN42]
MGATTTAATTVATPTTTSTPATAPTTTTAENASGETTAAKKKKKKKKKSASSAAAAAAANAQPETDNQVGKLDGGSTLVICRNKHWKYISSFHGPWLQLPPEVLESLAYNNYYTPHPPLDPAIFFDLVRIRKLVDDATNLACRAASGVSTGGGGGMGMNGSGGGGGGGGDMFGWGYGFGGGGNGGGGGGGHTTRLSKERRHRMRELATQKLAKAYALDEIAASVAMMQSASTLEDVALHVLTRNPNDTNAKYVHFFHEKIPSRALAAGTSLKLLDDVIADEPSAPHPLRTKAITRGFVDDWRGAVVDLTAALANAKAKQRERDHLRKQYHPGDKLADEDLPSSVEKQILFHRASAYLTIAISHIDVALGPQPQPQQKLIDVSTEPTPPPTPPAATPQQEQARKLLVSNAKRAIRDYTRFLSFFSYSPGSSSSTPPPTFPISTLFSSPPPNLPKPEVTASVTYHPLLTDALHSLLLAHLLLHTPPTVLQGHARMVAHLASLCDGYPVFLASRSPARADWIEVLKSTDGEKWLGVGRWEGLCEALPLPQLESSEPLRIEGSQAGALRRLREETGGLGGVGRRELMPSDGRGSGMGGAGIGGIGGGGGGGGGWVGGGGGGAVRRWAQEDGREYPVSGERAGRLGRWVREGKGGGMGSGVGKGREKGLVGAVERLRIEGGGRSEERRWVVCEP